MERLLSQKWVKPLLITVIILVILAVILIALTRGNSKEQSGLSDSTIIEVKDNGEYSYCLYANDTIGILSYLGSNSIITIPEKIDEIPVTRIEDSAFRASQLTGIVLPETIVHIGARAFYGCEYLSSLTIPQTVKTIGKDAFLIEKNNTCSFIPWVYTRGGEFVVVGDGILIAYIGNSPETLAIPDHVKFISRFYFRGNTIKEVILPEKLQGIGDSAFEDFTAITTINFPATLSKIGKRAFYNCKSLGELSLPESTKTIGDEAFACCPKMKTVTIVAATEIGERAFAYCLGLTSVKLPEKSLKTIGNGAFAECSLLSDIVIPSSLQTLGSGVLKGTAWMEQRSNQIFVVTDNGMLVGYNGNGGQVTIDDASITVVADAFAARTDITGVILGNSVKALSCGAFENCTSLEAVITSKYLEKIGDRAFAGCSALRQVDLLDGITQIGENAFENCTSLVSIKLPSALKTIPKSCFVGCSMLTEITLPAALAKIEQNAFHECPLELVHYSGSDKQKAKIKIEEGNAVFSAIFNH